MPPDDEWRLDNRCIGRRVLVHDRTDSTNDRAFELASDPANDGTVILAHEQTAGRGQHGRTWQCPPGTGVLLSVLLFPPPALRRAALLTAWAAVSVCETVHRVASLPATIKWPNDVLIRGRKACGILIETRSAEPGTRNAEWATVAGIGLNVNQTAEAFTARGLEHGTSLALAAGQPFDCADLARQLIRQLDDEYAALTAGEVATLEAGWKWRLGLLGQRVIVACAGAVYRGRLREVGWEGLELEAADGTIVRLRPELVQQMHKDE